MEPVHLLPGSPVLCIIVDAEEEFRWDRPISARNNTTASIRHQKRAQDIFAAYKVRPTYLVTYPVATDPVAAGQLRDYHLAGQCEIGAQLHPWVTPPCDAANEERLSYPGNLPPALEREKLLRLTDAVRTGLGVQPTVYKAGRYGLGCATATLLEEAGYLVDTSLIPRTRYAESGGPDFSDFDYAPFWFGRGRRLLELPVTRALTGCVSRFGPGLYRLAGHPAWRELRFAGLLARTRLVERITLSPEGCDLPAMQRLTDALLKRGQRIFTLSYHSPSLEPGNTPYVRTKRDLALFLDRLSGYLSFFMNELGGTVLTVRELHDQLRTGHVTALPASPAAAAPIAGDRRCLVVANTFPPVHGGSAIVYDSLARFGRGRVSVLAPRTDYRDGLPIQGWREFDRLAPFRVHRNHLLRTQLLPGNANPWQRLAGLGRDLLIRLATLRAIRRLVRQERIAVICIGELVAGGWLARWTRLLFGLTSVIYVHGEEISTRMPYDEGGRRRRQALGAADRVVAVSRFTRDMLVRDFAVPACKVELVSNGVDLARFTPRPRPGHLVARHGLDGRRVLLTIGRLSARKGMDRVIEALSTARRHVPDLVYLIVGEGPYRPHLESLVSSLGLEGHVILTGAVPAYELAGYYSLGDVFIMANREMADGETEGFGLVFLEANACGVPVIAGQAGGSVDAVTNELNGLIVDGDDSEHIAATIRRLFQDDGLRARLRAGGMEMARASGWDRRVGQFLRVCGVTTDPALD